MGFQCLVHTTCSRKFIKWPNGHLQNKSWLPNVYTSFTVKHVYLILKHTTDTAILSSVRASGYKGICKKNLLKKKTLHLYFPHFSSSRQGSSCKSYLYCNWIQPKCSCTRDYARGFNNPSAIQLLRMKLALFVVLGSCFWMSVTHLLVGNSAFKSFFYYILTLCASVLMLQKIGCCQDWMHPTCSNSVFMWIWPLIHKIPI